MPYWADQTLVVAALKRLYPHANFQLAVRGESSFIPWIHDDGDPCAPYRMPEAGTPVLVLGDLGCLARDEGASARQWLEFGRRLHAHGNRPLALLPCHPAHCPADLAKTWRLIPWERTGGAGGQAPSPDATRKLVERILRLHAFVLRVEPRMIRVLRRLFPEGRADAGIEALVWNDEALRGHTFEAARFDPSRVEQLRRELESAESPALRRQVLELVARMRHESCLAVWHAEVLGLSSALASDLPDASAHQDRARDWFDTLCAELTDDRHRRRPLRGHEAYWSRVVLAGLEPSPVLEGPDAPMFHALHGLAHGPGGPWPADSDPGLIPPTGAPVTLEIRQVDDHLEAHPFDGAPRAGSPIALVRTRNGLIKVEPILDDDARRALPGRWISGAMGLGTSPGSRWGASASGCGGSGQGGS